MEKGYETSTEQMILLNSYYHTLEDINGDVYTYTLEGNESVYNEIAKKCSTNQTRLKQLSEIHAGKQFYRDIRDVEQMFLLYIQRIKKIYDHSYLCEEMTIGSKAVINKYYNKTQEVYRSLESVSEPIFRAAGVCGLPQRTGVEKKFLVYCGYCSSGHICILQTGKKYCGTQQQCDSADSGPYGKCAAVRKTGYEPH